MAQPGLEVITLSLNTEIMHMTNIFEISSDPRQFTSITDKTNYAPDGCRATSKALKRSQVDFS